MRTGSAKLVAEVLLQRFLPLARRHIETAQAHVWIFRYTCVRLSVFLFRQPLLALPPSLLLAANLKLHPTENQTYFIFLFFEKLEIHLIFSEPPPRPHFLPLLLSPPPLFHHSPSAQNLICARPTPISGELIYLPSSSSKSHLANTHLRSTPIYPHLRRTLRHWLVIKERGKRAKREVE